MNATKPTLGALEESAATWAVRRADGFTPQMQAEFERWLAADPLHYAAFAEADLALGVLSAPRAAEERARLRNELAAWEKSRLAQRRRRRWAAFSTLGLAAAAVLLVTFVPFDAPPAPLAPLGTVTPRPLFRRLPDKSIVELNANTEISVEFSDAARLVRLTRGEAHFTVAKDPARPFVVSAGRVKVRAVGTQFNVRFNPDSIDVLTTEGRVRVTEEAAAAGPSLARGADVSAGQRTSVPLAPAPSTPAPLAVAVVSPAQIAQQLTWREMRFELSNATLEQAVALFNQRNLTQFAIGDPELRTLRLSGIYWADNPAQFAELVATSLDLKPVREGAERIVFRKR